MNKRTSRRELKNSTHWNTECPMTTHSKCVVKDKLQHLIVVDVNSSLHSIRRFYYIR